MPLNHQQIYISYQGDIPPDQIDIIAKGLIEKVLAVPIKKYFEEDFRSKLIDSCSLWIMDYPCLEFILAGSEAFNIAALPGITVLVNETLPQSIYELDLPENIDFVKYPNPQNLLKLQLKQGLKKALKHSERILEHERYNSLFVKSIQPKLILDPRTGKILDANKAAAQLFGKEIDDILQQDISALHPESFDTICDNLNPVLQGENATIKLKFLPSDNQLKELQYRLSLIVWGGKKLVLLNVDDITENGKAYELFYQQTEMLRNTLESIDDLLFSLNRDGDFIEYYQPSNGGNLTLSSDVFVGKNIYDVGFPLDVAKKYLYTIEQVIDEDKPEQIDYYMEAFGSKLWYNAKISPRKNVFGMVDGVTVLCRDVTRQKRTEETLKIARDFYLTLLADFPSMIWKTNTTKRAEYFNKTWLEFTGRDIAKEINTDWVEKIHLKDTSRFLSVLMNAYKKKEAFQIEHRLMHHSGEYRWVINAGRPFYNLNGQFEGFIGSCYDISGRRKAEEMMHLQKSAMESALEGILIIEDNGLDYPVIYANKELGRLTNSSIEDVVGESFLDVLGCPLEGSIQNDLIKALKKKKRFKGEFLCTKVKQDENPQWYLLYMSPVKDEIDNVNHFIAVLGDITEAKQVEKTLREKNYQLRKTNEELDSFVYSTSHELRSPLMSVLGLLNLLETEIDLEDRTTYLSMIRESISRLDKIIHDIIDYSRNSRLEVVNEKIDFNAMIEKIIIDHKYNENFGKVRFSLDVKDNGPFLSDRKRIQIILNNFISNSIWFHNFNQDDPFVEITVKTSSVNAIISVKDNGIGIHEKHMPKLYDMFYRGTEKSKGSGIGLYIVKEIVDKLNGSIQVQSSPESGTTFTVDLPNFINRNYNIVSLSESDSLSF